MYRGIEIVALVPARAGSQGIPRKNIKLFSGKPLIAHTIEAAKNSRWVDMVIVSTESPSIARIALEHGAQIPFMRPKPLATDKASSLAALFHAMSELNNPRHSVRIWVVLQPTSPLRTEVDIDRAIELLFEKRAKAIVSVTEAFTKPHLVNHLPKNGSMAKFIPKTMAQKNRQEHPKSFQLNGAVYLGYADYIKKCKGFYGDQTYAYIMPKERSIDIDDQIDFHMAEALFEQRKGKRRS